MQFGNRDNNERNNAMTTDVRKNPHDARTIAAKRVNAALDKFRMVGNTVNWALSQDEREIMADAIEQGAVELVGKLRNVVSTDSKFSF